MGKISPKSGFTGEEKGIMKKKQSIAWNIDAGQLSFWLLLIWILFMFAHSMTPGELSSRESGGMLHLVFQILEKFGVEAEWLTEHIIRKAAHFCEYSVFGILLLFYQSSRPKRRYGQRTRQLEAVYFMMLAVIAVPFCDETIQLFVPGRSGQLQDVWLDMAGSGAGILVSRMLQLGFCRWRAGRQRSQKSQGRIWLE